MASWNKTQPFWEGSYKLGYSAEDKGGFSRFKYSYAVESKQWLTVGHAQWEYDRTDSS